MRRPRHNIGFDVMDALAEKYDIEMNQKKEKAICGTGYMEGQKVLLAKPQTFMNLSGDSVAALMRFYKLDPAEDLIVVYDDISLAPGNLRIRKKGSAGGHNGIKDIIAKTGSDQFSPRKGRRRGKAGGLGPCGLCAEPLFGRRAETGGRGHRPCGGGAGADGSGADG